MSDEPENTCAYTYGKLSDYALMYGNNLLTGFGRISPMSKAYPEFLAQRLITDDGLPLRKDDLLSGLGAEILRRYLKGKLF